MVNDCLICGQPALPTYRKRSQIFDFAIAAAYNAALSIPDILDESAKRRPHRRTFPVQEHHAPQEPAGCTEVETVLQTGAGNHIRGQDWPAGTVDESAAARCAHFRPPGEHDEEL